MNRALSQRHLLPLLAACTLALAGAGCGAPEDGLGSVDESVVGGAFDPGDPAVVLLFAQKSGSNQGYLCSGTLIAPTVVLTAAHCVSPQTVGAGVTFAVFVGSDWNKPLADSWTDVRAVHWDQQFDVNKLAAGHDIAVVILASALTIAPVPVSRVAPDRSLVGKATRVVGFGANDGQTRGGVGLKRTVTTRLDDFSALLLHVGDSTHQSCEGDSGGPALMMQNGVETLVGVTSYGQVGCVLGGYHTRVDQYLPFIDLYVPPGGGNPPAVVPAPRTTPTSLPRKQG